MEKKEIAQVQIESNQIVFADKNSPTGFYKTGPMEDPSLVDRLYASGATFGTEIVKQQSFLVTFLLTWVLPLVVMIAIGQFLMRKIMNSGGGVNSMASEKATPRYTSSPKQASNSQTWPARTKPKRCSPNW